MQRRIGSTLVVCLLSTLSFAASALKPGDFKTSDGVRIHYVEAGAGPAILFVPGWTMAADIWQAQIDHFAQQYHVVAVDPRSQGDSEKAAEGNYPERRARDYKELVDHLKLTPVVLVGWSMGVPELLSYVDQFGPTGIRALVLVDGFVSMDPKILPPFLNGVVHNALANRRQFTNGFVQSMYKKPQKPEYLDHVVQTSLKTPTNNAMAAMAGMLSRLDWTPVLAKLTSTPVLFVAQGQMKDAASKLPAILPSLRLEVFEDAGHALFVDDADRFNTLLDQFLVANPAKP